MSKLRTFRRRMDITEISEKERAAALSSNGRKTGTMHEHYYSDLRTNWQGRTFEQCPKCGAIFFLPEAL